MAGERFAAYTDLSTVAARPLGDLVGGDPHGNLYVDDVGFAAHAGEPPRPDRLLRVGAAGSVGVAAERLEFPNGLAFVNGLAFLDHLAFVDGGRTLIVAKTARQPADRVRRGGGRGAREPAHLRRPRPSDRR